MVTHGHNQFIIHADGQRVGHTDYRDHDGERLFYHTEVTPEFGGRGLAGQLISDALAQTDLPIVAICPFVRGWLEKNDHDHTWRKPTPADITWLQKELR
ncbi:putative acetyltransferase [Corynebacterium humireducens NBRC 106098 = DSM 45392]|uniref:Putative acetyltransferase n=1 Tax=Corynebacterium humireducens NBRC 106098 = DSM 45392 TaxID=1223515 RepID=A0A0B5DA46_9CORY|nr:GNAT family N-acetyltransferase [Corynebacterium humireducens]AJE33852.1 putative acetyltransferase [Corynebacterium humireducens NBRC 106098 = DSM 45392]